MKAEVTIVPMTPRHLERVLEIEKASFSSPWSKRIFYQELAGNPYATYVVAMAGEELVGYAGIWLVLDEAHVTNIAVSPQWRRRGVARQLLDHLLRVAYSQGARGATLEVRKSNAVARNLYASLGFAAVGVRKEYDTDNKEDAVIMWLRDLSAYFERKEQADG